MFHLLNEVVLTSCFLMQLEDMFRMIDINGDGTLQSSELQEVLGDQIAYFMKPWSNCKDPNFKLDRTEFVTGILKECASMSDYEFKVFKLDKMSRCINSSKSAKMAKVKSRIVDLTVQHGKLLVSQMKLYYKRQFGEVLDEAEFGFKSASDLLRQCKDVVKITSERSGLVAVPYTKLSTDGGANGENASADLSTLKSRITQLADDHGPFQAGPMITVSLQQPSSSNVTLLKPAPELWCFHHVANIAFRRQSGREERYPTGVSILELTG